MFSRAQKRNQRRNRANYLNSLNVEQRQEALEAKAKGHVWQIHVKPKDSTKTLKKAESNPSTVIPAYRHSQPKDTGYVATCIGCQGRYKILEENPLLNEGYQILREQRLEEEGLFLDWNELEPHYECPKCADSWDSFGDFIISDSLSLSDKACKEHSSELYRHYSNMEDCRDIRKLLSPIN